MSCRMRACEVATYVEHMPFIVPCRVRARELASVPKWGSRQVPCRVRAREQVTSEIGRDLT